MKKRDIKIPLIITLIYWIPASLALLDIMEGSGMIFPFWLSFILFPGYFLGFAFGYGGGTSWALIGQLITLPLLFLISRIIYEPFRKK